MPNIGNKDGFLTQITGFAERAIVVFYKVTHNAIGALTGSGHIAVAAEPYLALGVHTDDIVEQINVLALRLYENGKVACTNGNFTLFLGNHTVIVGVKVFGKTHIFSRHHPAVEGPVFAFVVGVHQADVTEIGVELGMAANAKSIITGTLAVPSTFVMEEGKETMGDGTDIKTKGPNAATGFYTFGITNVIVGIVRMTYAEIGVDGIHFLHVIQGRAAEHSHMTHMRHAGNGPQLTIYISIHRNRAILMNAHLLLKRCFLVLVNLDRKFHGKILLCCTT